MFWNKQFVAFCRSLISLLAIIFFFFFINIIFFRFEEIILEYHLNQLLEYNRIDFF